MRVGGISKQVNWKFRQRVLYIFFRATDTVLSSGLCSLARTVQGHQGTSHKQQGYYNANGYAPPRRGGIVLA